MNAEARAPASRALAPRAPRPDERLARRGGAIELLRVPAALFEAAARARAALYDTGLLWSERVDACVVSVGNLTAGGTGKTPMVALLARELERRGFRAGVLSRGYRAKPGELNDEAQLLAELLPDAPYAQDPDRVRGARSLIARGVDAIVLDDGFQHRRIARDLDVVLVDATRPWGLARDANGASVRALLPRGLLREPPSALHRANAIVITRADQVDPTVLDELEREIAELAPGTPVLTAVHRPTSVRDLRGVRGVPESLAGREVDLISGIGNPEAFAAAVRSLGATVREERCFPDHHDFKREDLDGLARGERLLLCTSKDAVKLRALGVSALALEVELAIVRGAMVLEALLDALPPSRAQRERAALHEGLAG